MMEDTARQSRDCAARPLSVAPPRRDGTPGEGTFYLVDCGMMEDTARQSRDCAARPLSVAPPRRDGRPARERSIWWTVE